MQQGFWTDLWYKDETEREGRTEDEQERDQAESDGDLVIAQHMRSGHPEEADDNHVVDCEADVFGVIEGRNADGTGLPGQEETKDQ